ncbi:C4-dicarboxylate-specific signal transduction histidine kinase [Archangium gephyra]|uniref:histidine kinase n=2 Tax=Archangium gephyra TaxID=48 RepID=A0ABX9JWJ5_9BACT|nr:ATP-binding protein [Archangium gephyra]REG28588.1 C4-dicarboxylate-specific signal transduction histidine kinase [Archangium gephyra]
MGVRIAVVIALSTLFSYLHMFHTLRTEALSRLQQYVAERGQREQAIFLLAEDNHAILKKALEEKSRAYQHEDVSARFDSLFALMPDGAIRNRPEMFDGTRMPCLFVPRGVPVDLEQRRRLLAAYDVLLQYGPAFRTRFADSFITLPEGSLVMFWPERPNWIHESDPTTSIITQDFFPGSLPENNPKRQTTWSPIYEEPVSLQAMSTVTTPLDMDGRHVASISHDVMIEELMARTIHDHLPESYNLVFRDDGKLIAHPGLKQEGGTTEEQQAHLRSIVEQVKSSPSGQVIQTHPGTGEYLAVTRLKGPGWYFVTVLPESAVSRPALQAARIVLLLGVLSLLIELAVVSWVLRQQITRPLLSFTQATDRVAAGDFKVELDTTREDELGQLARAFRLMADHVQRREEELRHVNESLEQRVEERTRELKEVHLQLVQTARRAGMAEIATNVLHNVGNVLNSVYTSAQLARERMTDMRLEHVGRVADMLQENQSELGTFLTQDARGRNLMPFMSKLGQNLLDERKQIVTLLEDVGRYTEHVGDIVKVQQNYARTPRLQEPVHLAGLVEDALRINAAGLTRHQVTVERQLAEIPPVLTDKHKTLMILVNLVSNAKYAMDGVPVNERRLIVKLEHTPSDHVRISIHDNGMGIAPEMLTRIFQYGFTTREEGHGFGLHSSALAAQEMGGVLTVHSEGPGHGATFTLEMPYHPA